MLPSFTPLWGQTGRVVVFLAKPLVGPLLRPLGSPQLPPSPWQNCLLSCVGGWGAALGLFPLPSPSEGILGPGVWTFGDLDEWEGCSALSLPPQPCSSAIAATQPRSTLPPAPTSAGQVARNAASSSPCAPRGARAMGISLSRGQLSGWGGESRWTRGL